MAQRSVGAYGDPWARTPNIDRLAHEGVRFANSYTPCPLCLPARAAFWTGRLPHQTGVVSNGRLLDIPTTPEDRPTLGSLFSQAGYECLHFGKAHDGGTLRGFRHEAGEFLTALDASGRREDTLVVFCADHGDGMTSLAWQPSK